MIHPSASINHSVLSTLRGAFEYQGQKCSATSRLYVPESIWPEFKDQLVGAMSQITIGNSSEPENLNTFMGPVIHEQSFKNYLMPLNKLNQIQNWKSLLVAHMITLRDSMFNQH